MANSEACDLFIESPDTVHGRLMESTHLAGYTMARACKEFEWLLEDNKWQKVGKGFDHINDFLATIDLSEFKISIEQRKKLAEKLAKIQASQRATGRTLGIGKSTINRDLETVPNGTLKQKQPLKNQGVIDDNVPNGTPIPNITGEEMLKAAERAGKSNEQFRTSYTGENEWYTPMQYIEAAREVMDDIDLDPATSEYGQSRIQAKKYYTIANDGLTKSWFGRIWMNPPYSQPAITQFIDKFIHEYEQGNIAQAIVLTHNYTDTKWFHNLVKRANRICFTLGRIRFENEKGERAAPTQGQAFFYFGKNIIGFEKIFGKIGFIR